MNFCFKKQPSMCEIVDEICPFGQSKVEILSNSSRNNECERNISQGSKDRILTCNNILWLNTMFFSFPFCIDKMRPDRIYSSVPIDCKSYPATFSLDIMRHESLFVVEMVRIFKNCDAGKTPSKHNGGYFLRILFHVSNSLESDKIKDMRFGSKGAKVFFSLEHFRPFQSRQNPIDIKCVIWMHETACDDNKLSEFYRKNLNEELKNGIQQNPKLYVEIAYLMNMPSLDRVFSGREDENMLKQKTLLLRRTIVFSSSLATLMKCIEKNLPYCGFPVDCILGYISNGFIHSVEKGECLSLFLQSCTFGLQYLQIVIATFLQHNIITVFPKRNSNEYGSTKSEKIFNGFMYDCNIDFLLLLNVILLANRCHSVQLLNFTIDYFVMFKKNIMKCIEWETLLNQHPSQSRIILSLADKKGIK